jgi:hypothetical protein
MNHWVLDERKLNERLLFRVLQALGLATILAYQSHRNRLLVPDLPMALVGLVRLVMSVRARFPLLTGTDRRR